MKILAIRGENIASLHGPYEVDLTTGPLADAGLFAICGATGAGKSTLLDTICLALFDTTPRLASRGGAAVGRADQDKKDRLPANDVRGLLTRGTAGGFAEVDFVGVDQRRYRARWTVRRSRNKPSGRLQKQEMQLTQLATGETLGDKKTEILGEIERCLGLTFDQFKRSAMLAQGDFAAFLHADAGARADLLERVTGTAVYSRISQASYQRTKAEQDAYRTLEVEAEKLGRLTPEKRDELDANIVIAQEEEATAAASHKQAETTAAWFTEDDRLGEQLAKAQSLVTQAETQHAGAEPRRERLAQIERVEVLRVPLDRLASAREQAEHARIQRDKAVEQELEAQRVVERNEAAANERKEQHQQAKQRLSALAPALREARALDTRLEDQRRQHRDASEEANRAEGVAAATATAQRTEQAKRDEQLAQRDAAQQWLAAHPALEALAGALAPLQKALTDLDRARGELRTHREALPALAEKQTGATAAYAAANQAHTGALEQEKAAHTALHTARQALPESAQREHRAARDTHHQRDKQLAALAHLHQRALDAHAAIEAHTDALSEQERRRDDASAALSTAATALKELAVRRDEAEQSARRTRAAFDVRDHRERLVEGEPCVVCGATEHPWADHGAVKALLDEAELRLQALDAERTKVQAEHETATKAHSRASTAVESETKQLEQARRAARAAQEEWARERLDGLPDDPNDAADDLQRLQAQAQTQALALAQRGEELDQLQRAIDSAAAAYERQKQKRERTQAAVERCRQQAEEARRQHDALQEALRSATREEASAEAAAAELLHAVPGWREQPPLVLRDDLSAQVRDWRTYQQRLEAAREALSALNPKVEALAATLQAQQQAAAKARSAADALAATLRELSAARAELLDGRPADEVEQQAQAAVDRADEARATAAEAKAQADKALAAATKERSTREDAVRSSASAVQTCQQALDAALLEHQVDRATVEALLSTTREEVAAERAALAALDKAVTEARSVQQERQKLLDTHREQLPSLSREAATKALSTASQRLDAARSTLADRRADARRDDLARQQGAELDEKLRAQLAIVDQWKAISDLIGSADGKAFRTFAQGLTLDALLVHANHHLKDLNPRYRIERVPGEDLELQVVDQDMGDEIRPIPSLSGGETFLASLSLALGLSSLSASDTPVESLFIDEGFGTLDRDTLELALAALDALQASGRQVGLISHVDGLAEHIGVAVRVDKLGAGRSRVITP